MQKIFSIAIDGPAGAGKSTVAKAVAKALGANYLDTGAMYRTVGLYMNQQHITGNDAIAKAAETPQIEVSFINGEQHMILNGTDVTSMIRSPEASMLASKVSAVPAVRERMVALQREIAQGTSVVMDGRDIGTCVLPDATLKIYLTASCEVRAKRRYDELTKAGKEQPYDDVFADIVKRDYDDSHRAVSPMRQARDAVRVDTSAMTPEQVVDDIVARAKAAIGD